MVIILTGPTAAGKSSVARALAARVSRCALIEYDDIHRMFAKPHVPPWLAEWFVQQLIGVRMIADIARRFLDDGYDVIVADVLSPDTARLYREIFVEQKPKIVQLLPPSEVVRARFYDRGPVLTDEEFARVCHEQEEFSAYDLRIDNTSLSPEEVAGRILAA